MLPLLESIRRHPERKHQQQDAKSGGTPLIERNPLVFWKSVSALLAMAVIALLVMMVVTYGYPIGQFFFLKSHSVPAIEVTSQEANPAGVW